MYSPVISNDQALNSQYSPMHYILIMSIYKTTVKSLVLFTLGRPFNRLIIRRSKYRDTEIVLDFNGHLSGV